MTARAAGTGTDADDLDIEEALALVKERPASPTPPGTPASAGPAAPGTQGPAPAGPAAPGPASAEPAASGTHGPTSGPAAPGAPGPAFAEPAASGTHGPTFAEPAVPGTQGPASTGPGAAAHGPTPTEPATTPTAHATTPTPSATRPARPPHRSTPWRDARALAVRAARGGTRRAPVPVPLEAALGLPLAVPLTALTDLPSFDTSAMDGWAVAGPGPWAVRDEGVLAGHGTHPPLADGEAARIATGARVPADTTAVLRSEHGRTEHSRTEAGRLHALRPVVQGQDIRPRGQECRTGDQLLPAGTTVTPAVLGLAAAAGYDVLTVAPRPRAEILVLGDELLTEGLPHGGLIRDALGPMLPSWLRALGAEVIAVRRLGDDAEALHRAVLDSDADVLLTTGGTAAGPVDHVHPTLRRTGADLLVDGVQVRPGHPMLLARTENDQYLVGLPGNPLAAVSGLLTLAEPLLRGLAARPAPEPYLRPLREAVQGHPHDTRLVPVALRGGRTVPLHYNGPAMLRGIAAADALAVVPPGGARADQEVELLALPWAAGANGGCFT